MSVASRLDHPVVRDLRERPQLQPLRRVANAAIRRGRREKRRAKRQYRYWRKHELTWVVLLLVLSRRDARSRVLRELAEADVRDLRNHLPRWALKRR